MSFLQWNCRSLKNKKIWLHQPPFTTSEFWVFQETFLKADDRLSFPNKIFFRTHHNNRTGGGLIIGIPTNMSGRVIFENSNDPNLEMLAVEIQSHNVTFTIVNIYAPHGFDINQVQKIFSTLKMRTCIFGDFNLHHPFWGGKTSTPKSEEFLDWLNQSHFSILNTSTPTHITHNFTSSVIDLTLCSAAPLNEVYCYVSDCTFESDHLPIVVSWSKLTNATKYLKTIYWNPILRDSNTFLQSIADPTVEIVTEKISHTININTKNQILPNNEYPPGWNIACNNFCHLKKIMWKKARNSVSVLDWIRFKKYRSKLKYHIKRAKQKYWENISNIPRNPKLFFRILNKLNNHNDPDIKNSKILFHNNRYISNPKQQSNLFANYFSAQNFRSEPIPLDYSIDNKFLNKNIELWELRKSIQKMRNTTPGADNIPAALQFPETATIPITDNDVKKITNLLQRPYIQNNIQWQQQIQILLEKLKKAEIEGLSKISDDFLPKIYLPNKVRHGGWI
ncbi:RNA-directed DNA polymerase from mobile element jockey [Caerostris darwini]|uniref:RNA-directed DNA polymerase from mobile element jockey n=1 Tax=Caerostris darwini TaxID=1538125 RepID=A0AAV4SAD7_9ARAC|nr:RNA-directed DNA polymerase from mobile element jockey [Caerostris darwini]